MTSDTYRACALAHVDLAFQVQNWTSCEPESLEVSIKCNMAKIVVVVSAPEWANKTFIDHATVLVVVEHFNFKISCRLEVV